MLFGNHTVLWSCCYTVFEQSTFAIALLVLSSNDYISSGCMNRLFRTISVPHPAGFLLVSPSGARVFRSIRMTGYTQPMQYGAEKRPNNDSWWQVCSYVHHL